MRQASWNPWRIFERSGTSGGGRGKSSRRPRRTRPLLEQLEVRALLSANLPVANNDLTTVDGPVPVVINVLSNDSAPSGLNAGTVTIQSFPQHGSATVAANGQVTYQAVSGFNGTDSFTYTVQDTHGTASNPATVTVLVGGPTAYDDQRLTFAGISVNIPVLENDNAPPAPAPQFDPSTVAVVAGSGPTHGTVSVETTGDNAGSIDYTPNPGFAGTDVFQYTVKDTNGAISNPAFVTVVVQRPQANDDTATTNENTAVTIGVLANDTDPPTIPAPPPPGVEPGTPTPNSLDPTSVAIVGHGPANGTAVANSNGTITYTPAPGFSGEDSFQYTVEDATTHAVSNPATVTVTVVNNGTLNGDTATTEAGSPVTIDVLANDSAPAPLTLNPNTVMVQTKPAQGTAVVQSGGAILYTPVNGFSGTDTFTYTVENSNGVTLPAATVTVTITRPQANDYQSVTDAGNPVDIPVLSVDTAPTGQQLDPTTVTVVGNPAHGTAVVQPDGSILYTSVESFKGTDFFQYTVKDKSGAISNPGTVSVVVNRPQADDDFATVEAAPGASVNIPVLNNDTDPDGPNLLNLGSVKIVANPGHGNVSINTTDGDPKEGSITYTPLPGFVGTDTFQYTVQDVRNATSDPATVTVVVNRPTAENDTAVTTGTTPVTVNVLANDSSPAGPGQLLASSVTVVTAASHGSTHVNADGSITYTPQAGFSGIDTFGYTEMDTAGGTSNTGTVSVAVNPPTANPDTATTVGTTPVAISVLGVDSAPVAPLVPSTLVVTSGPSHGSVSVNPSTGQVTYTAVPGFVGTDTFSYHVADVNGSETNVTTVTVNVTHAPRPEVGPARHGHRPRTGPKVVVENPVTGAPLFTLTPYGRRFHGGINVALGDVNGDGVFDVITAAATGCHPVLIFDGRTGALLASLQVPGARHANGLSVASLDVNGDGRDDVVVRFGSGRHTQFAAVNGATGAVIPGLSQAQLDQLFAEGLTA